MEKGFFKKNKILGINLIYIVSIIPIILFGFYKNGIQVFQKGYISFFLATQYLVIPIIIIILSYVFETYYYLGIKKEEDTHSVINSIVPYINALCYLVCGPTNFLWLTMPLIIMIDIALKFIDNKWNINQIALFKCLLFCILYIMGYTNNANLYEASLTESVKNISSLFIGFGVGEIGTTSTLCALIGYGILLFNSYFKKDIPSYCILGYAIVCIIMFLVGGLSYYDLVANTFNSGFIFASIFVASLSTATPVVRSGRLFYGILIGALSALSVNIFHFNIGIYIIILILSLITPLLNKFKISLE